MRRRLLLLNCVALVLSVGCMVVWLIAKADVAGDGTLLAEAKELRELSVSAARYDEAINHLLTSAQSRLDTAKFLTNAYFLVGILNVVVLSLNYVHIRRSSADGQSKECAAASA